jgi:hypothetical protein
MTEAQLREVIQGIIEDHEEHACIPECLADSLTESWLKDRDRAVRQVRPS